MKKREYENIEPELNRSLLSNEIKKFDEMKQAIVNNAQVSNFSTNSSIPIPNALQGHVGFAVRKTSSQQRQSRRFNK